jgi:hypothetical protein
VAKYGIRRRAALPRKFLIKKVAALQSVFGRLYRQHSKCKWSWGMAELETIDVLVAASEPEIDMQVEVSAEGGIQLMGTAKADGKGAITLTFQRPLEKA